MGNGPLDWGCGGSRNWGEIPKMELTLLTQDGKLERG